MGKVSDERPSGELRLPDDVLVELCRYGTSHAYRSGDIVFEERTPGTCMYVVESGAVDLALDGGLSRKRLGPGQYFGELSLIVGSHLRSATATVSTDAVLCMVDQAAFERLLRAAPAASVTLLRTTCEYLLRSERQLVTDLDRRNRELSRTLDFLRRTRQDLDARELEVRTDTLTGLYNRRCLDEQSGPMMVRAARNATPLALMVVDIDRFKAVNDQYGHLVGDTLLRQFANLLQAAVRQTDLPCRIGGDEFAILAPDLDGIQARAMAGRLLKAVRGLRLPVPSQALQITCSVGGAMLRGDDDWQQLFERADAYLYRAKEAGRNRVHWDEA